MTRLMLNELKGLDQYSWLLDGKLAYRISLHMEKKSALGSLECFGHLADSYTPVAILKL